MTVADRIRQRRIELNMSQAELAQKAKYSDKTRISKLENAGDDISMKQVKRVAVALDTTPAHLMGWEDPIRTDANTPTDHVDITNYREAELANRLYHLYQQAPSEIQAAVETLLRVSKSDS